MEKFTEDKKRAFHVSGMSSWFWGVLSSYSGKEFKNDKTSPLPWS